MYWADSLKDKIKEKYQANIKSGEPLVIRDEKTASGRVHVGSLRGVAIHGIIAEILVEEGIKNTYLYEINDFDPMDGIPAYLDQEKYLPYMGFSLCDIPSPDGKAKNFAEYFGQEFTGTIRKIGFEPKFVRASDSYKEGKFNETIILALEKAGLIREIYKKISGSERAPGWLPIHLRCENCKKISTTKATAFDGKEVSYTCGDFVEWAKGCGHSGKISPLNGNAKLPWKVEWAAKFKIFNVSVEGAGKDHSTKGGARDVADAISRQVFEHEPPFNIPYEFLNVSGKKMSSSKGRGSSAEDVAELVPPHILRLLFLGKEPQKVIDFVPDGDTIPILYDTYDKFALNYFNGVKDDYSRLFELIHVPEQRKNIKKTMLPRFSEIAYLVQMPHLDIYKEVEKGQNKQIGPEDKIEIDERIKYAKIWLGTYAPEDYKFEIQKALPEKAKTFSEDQKKALGEVLQYIISNTKFDGEALHTELHEIRKRTNIDPKEFFKAIYLSILGKESGPKAGWFLSVLDREFLIKRFKEIL